MRPTITIKLKPYLQEFLICKLSDHDFLSQKNVITAMIEPLLEYAPGHILTEKPSKNSVTLKLPQKINLKYTINHTVYISEHNQRIFERMLKLYFKDVFHFYVADKIRYTKSIKDSIFLFCIDYQISFNAINYELLKKSFYRFQKLREKNKYKTSLMCPLNHMLC